MTFKISVSVNAIGVAFDLKELSKGIEKVNQATALAKYLDDCQYFFCQEIRNSDKDAHYVDTLRRFRIIIVAYITRLGIFLEQIKTDPNNNELKEEWLHFSSQMSKLMQKLERILLQPLTNSRISTSSSQREIGNSELSLKGFDESQVAMYESDILEAGMLLGLSHEDVDEVLQVSKINNSTIHKPRTERKRN
jgi:hypothetical protein